MKMPISMRSHGNAVWKQYLRVELARASALVAKPERPTLSARFACRWEICNR